MNIRRRIGSAILATSLASIAFGQDARQPGEPANTATPGISKPVYLSGSGELPASALRSSRIASAPHDRGAIIWKVSIAALLAASAFDAASSMGKVEQNPLLRSSDGTFGGKGIAVKFGLMGAAITPQILLRNRKDLRKLFTGLNFGETAMFTAIGAHNMGIEPVK
jgi:hypothetical protein